MDACLELDHSRLGGEGSGSLTISPERGGMSLGSRSVGPVRWYPLLSCYYEPPPPPALQSLLGVRKAMCDVPVPSKGILQSLEGH